jgi:aryl-alcohol dehydrogenase-like predicted oxidoreductase
VVPIPGTKRRSYLEENVAAASIALTAEELAALNAAAPIGAIAGPRYGAEMR